MMLFSQRVFAITLVKEGDDQQISAVQPARFFMCWYVNSSGGFIDTFEYIIVRKYGHYFLFSCSERFCWTSLRIESAAPTTR